MKVTFFVIMGQAQALLYFVNFGVPGPELNGKNNNQDYFVNCKTLLHDLIVFWFSRRREIRADAAGAEYASRSGMINALQRLRSEQGLPNDMPGEMCAFGISGDPKHGLPGRFLTHPPLEKRIAALQAAN